MAKYDGVAHRYNEFYSTPTHKEEDGDVVRFIQEHLDKIDIRVLDLGCGTGAGLTYLTDAGATVSFYAGVDESTEMLSIFQKNRSPDACDSITLIYDTMSRMSLWENTLSAFRPFDVICAFWSLNYLSEAKLLDVLGSARRVLQNNGIFFAIVYHENFPRSDDYIRIDAAADVPPHIHDPSAFAHVAGFDWATEVICDRLTKRDKFHLLAGRKT